MITAPSYCDGTKTLDGVEDAVSSFLRLEPSILRTTYIAPSSLFTLVINLREGAEAAPPCIVVLKIYLEKC